MEINRQLEEILSWRFVTEMFRRFPNDFTIIEAHPCSGQYDCLVMVRSNRDNNLSFAIDVNRNGGSVHVHQAAFDIGPDTTLHTDWTEQMLGHSPSRFLDKIAEDARLQIPTKLPTSAPETLIYRFIADFLTHSIGRLDKWECRNGFFDSSEYSNANNGWFESFPYLLKSDTKARDLEWHNNTSYAYNFWFLLKNNKPMLCLSKEGKVYTKRDKAYDLSELYKKNRKIWPLISQIAGDLLP